MTTQGSPERPYTPTDRQAHPSPVSGPPLDWMMAAVCPAMGYVGYKRAGNHMASLLVGAGFGAAYLVTDYYIKNVNPRMGHQIGAATSVALAGYKGFKLMEPPGPLKMPSAVLAGAGAVGLVYHYMGMKENKDFKTGRIMQPRH